MTMEFPIPPRKKLSLWAWLAFFLITVTSGVLFWNRAMQASIWTVPYTSGAANWSPGRSWHVEKQSVDRFKELPSSEKAKYRMPVVSGADLVQYTGPLDPGFICVTWLARRLFPMLGDIQAISVLNFLVHLACCAMLFRLFPTRIERVGFLIFYAANPLILHVCTYPYYYFWQMLPSACVIYGCLRHWKLSPWETLGIAVLCAFGIAIRPSTLFVAGGCIVYIVWKNRTVWSAFALALLAISFLSVPGSPKTPYMPMYVGLGAYPNAAGLRLSDNVAYERFKQETGKEIEFDLGGNYYDSSFRALYATILKREFFQYAFSHKEEIIRNFALNIAQGFSVGYITRQPYGLHVLVAATGIACALLLLLTGQWIPVLGNALCLGAFAPYYPPIPAYMFGSYILLACGCIWAFVRIGALARRGSVSRASH
jgi:hypothetical protein